MTLCQGTAVDKSSIAFFHGQRRTASAHIAAYFSDVLDRDHFRMLDAGMFGSQFEIELFADRDYEDQILTGIGLCDQCLENTAGIFPMACAT